MLRRIWGIDRASLGYVTPSLAALVIANVVPLLGVLFLNWQVFPILLLFWIENIIIGVFNVIKMAVSSPSSGENWIAKTAAIPFFCIHYGIFTLVHGLFILILFGGLFSGEQEYPDVNSVLSVIGDLNLWWAVLALIASHGISFVVNYIGKGEYRKATINGLMGKPYARVVILHLTVIFGAFLLLAFDAPVLGLALLVIIKVVIDIIAHIKEHGKYRAGN